MNRTKIEWTNYTWNPITGCKHGCWYCYAHKMFTRFHRSWEPTFHPERLDDPFRVDMRRRHGRIKIFVCSVADIFASWTPTEWRDKVLEVVTHAGLRFIDFQLLTKNPELIPKDYKFSDNVWVGATISLQEEDWRARQLRWAQARVHFLSFEPLLGPIHLTDTELEDIEWIIIGKLTGSRKVKLDPSWVQSILDAARKKGIPVFIKNNVGWLEKIQEFPKP